MHRGLQLLLFCCLASTVVYAADSAPPFDLTGPKVDVRVKRGEVTLFSKVMQDIGYRNTLAGASGQP
jgi:hypothetical protein